jgi:hypothetical protein
MKVIEVVKPSNYHDYPHETILVEMSGDDWNKLERIAHGDKQERINVGDVVAVPSIWSYFCKFDALKNIVTGIESRGKDLLELAAQINGLDKAGVK